METQTGATDMSATNPDHRGNLPMSDADLAGFVFHLRHSGWGFPPANPAADALNTLYAMVMEADADELETLAEDIAGHARAYAQKKLEDAA
jgi:hypothetical protein